MICVSYEPIKPNASIVTNFWKSFICHTDQIQTTVYLLLFFNRTVHFTANNTLKNLFIPIFRDQSVGESITLYIVLLISCYCCGFYIYFLYPFSSVKPFLGNIVKSGSSSVLL